MANDLLGDQIGSLYEYALTKGRMPFHRNMQRKLFKTGDVSNLGGAINVVFGAPVYDTVNREANAHTVLGTQPWERSGFRTADLSNADPSTRVTGGADPGTVSIVDAAPTEISGKPAFLHTAWDITMDAGFRTEHDDGLDAYEWKRQIYRDIHAEGLNIELLRSAEAESSSIGGTNTSDAKNSGNGQGLESLDRAIASDAEEDDVAGTGTGHYDLFGGDMDRDSGTDYDSVVVRPDGSKGTFGTNLTFQLAGVDQVINDTEDNGADPSSQIFLTGRDTRQLLDDEFQSQGRYDAGQVTAKLDMNGLTPSATHDGHDLAFTLRSYRDRPIVADKNVPANGTTAPDGGTGSSHLFLMDQGEIHMKNGWPTLYFDIDNPAVRGQFDTRALYVTAEQLYPTNPRVSGKVRSIS